MAVQVLTGISLGYNIAALCHGDPIAMHLQVQLLHMFRQIRDEVGVGMGYLVALVLGLNGGEVGQPASLPPSPPPGQGLQDCSGYFTQYSRE